MNPDAATLGKAHRGSASAAHGANLCDIFARTVAAHPGLVALEIPPAQGRARVQLTYAELERMADAVAALLAPFAARDAVVALAMPRTDERIFAAMLGVMRAGCAYAAIDPAFPPAQAAAIVRDAAAVAIIADAGRAQEIRAAGGNAPLVDAARIALRDAGTWSGSTVASDAQGAQRGAGARAPGDAAPHVDPASLAYVIYTSGTTGQPKGVEIEHRAIANLVVGDRAEFGMRPGDRIVQGSSASYDSSVEEMWLAWAAGATALVMDDETARLGPDLLPWLAREAATVLCPPPTLLRTLGCTDPARQLPALRLLYVGGEALPADIAALWGSGRRLENGYGPTECTVTCMRGTVRPGEAVTIGRAIPGVRAWVVDDALAPVAQDVQGELVIGGASLARGYRGQPGATAERFVQHAALGRIYRTGDLVHRDARGDFHYHGRIDAQVKLRGYRIELGAVEAALAAQPAVLEAACTVEGEGAHRRLVAHAVLRTGAVLDAEALRAALATRLPPYMVPATIVRIGALPRSVGGKLDRARLPRAVAAPQPGADFQAPSGETEELVARAVAEAAGITGPVSATADFFDELALDSLTVAIAVSKLRAHARTRHATVRLSYQHRSVRAAAAALDARAPVPVPLPESVPTGAELPARRGTAHPLAVTCAQAAVLALFLVAGAQLAWMPAIGTALARIEVMPAALQAIAIASLAAGIFATYALGTVLLAVAAKWTLIGRYRPLRARAWSGWHLRHWMTERCASLVPWEVIMSAGLAPAVLRLLGARVGRNVHLHRGVRLASGGWDLLTLQEGATIGQDALISPVRLVGGCIEVAPVRIGRQATVETRAGVAPGAELPERCVLRALSYLEPCSCEPGSVLDGIPAERVADAPPPPEVPPALAPVLFASLALLMLATVWTLVAAVWPAAFLLWGFDAAGAIRAVLDGAIEWPSMATAARLVGATATATACTVLVQAVLVHALGRAPAGAFALRSATGLRLSMQSLLVEGAGKLLSGSLLWPLWLRAAGARIDPDCEISTVTDVIPSQVTLGRETFFADGIYLGGPRVHAGTGVVAPIVLGAGCFVGNHAVLPGGTQLAPGTLVGISTRGDGLTAASEQSWFGHPAILLPRREIVHASRDVTHDPPLVRRINRWCWELARFLLPALPLVVAAVWLRAMAAAHAALEPLVFRIIALPAGILAAAAVLVLCTIALKWALLGRVRPGLHPLWSCWCSRWDFVYVAWGMWAAVPLAFLEGTLLLNHALRATGCRIGRRVLLGQGFAHVVDPDMLQLDDDTTVQALFQAHTFEDRVLKIDRVRLHRGATVGANAVLLYGAQVGAQAIVEPHAVVMKREELLPGQVYAGAPTHAVGPAPG